MRISVIGFFKFWCAVFLAMNLIYGFMVLPNLIEDQNQEFERYSQGLVHFGEAVDIKVTEHCEKASFPQSLIGYVRPDRAMSWFAPKCQYQPEKLTTEQSQKVLAVLNECVSTRVAQIKGVVGYVGIQALYDSQQWCGGAFGA